MAHLLQRTNLIKLLALAGFCCFSACAVAAPPIDLHFAALDDLRQSDERLPLRACSAKNNIDCIESGPVLNWDIAIADKTVNGTIARWAESAGWQLLWELPADYAVEARTTVSGTFEEAIETVAKGLASAEVPIKVIFYTQNKVLRVIGMGNQ